VETLDGHCGMSEYYSRDGPDGKWLGLATPPSSEFKRPPVCPTCHSAITAPRYGRVYKRADLDILERNVASSMSGALHNISTSLSEQAKSTIQQQLVSDVAKLKASATRRPPGAHKARKAILEDTESLLPVFPKVLDAGNANLHGISPVAAASWGSRTRDLFSIYSTAQNIATTRSAHVNAWEAAFSCLYQREMDLAVADPAHAPRRLPEHAMHIARMSVGQPRPLADKRFIVEAFWLTLSVRFTIAELALAWLRESGKNSKYTPEQCQAWASYVCFILDTCKRDADIAFQIAQKSESRRQMTHTTSYILRAELERFRVDVEASRISGTWGEGRKQLGKKATEKLQSATKYAEEVTRSHLKTPRSADPAKEKTWIQDNFSNLAEAILKEWRGLQRSLYLDTFYNPVSMEEKMKIVRGLGFAHTGHFYVCPNGHVYVIDNCGRAMDRLGGRCNECGAPIGGQNHTLDSTNR